MLRLHLFGILANIFVFLDLAGCLELLPTASHRPVVDAEHPRNLAVGQLGNL
jgi:hypothetical protein